MYVQNVVVKKRNLEHTKVFLCVSAFGSCCDCRNLTGFLKSHCVLACSKIHKKICVLVRQVVVAEIAFLGHIVQLVKCLFQFRNICKFDLVIVQIIYNIRNKILIFSADLSKPHSLMPAVCTWLIDWSYLIVKKCLTYFLKLCKCSWNFQLILFKNLLVVNYIIICGNVEISHSVNLVAYRSLLFCKLIIGLYPWLIGKIYCVFFYVILGNNIKGSGLSAKDIRTLTTVQFCHQHIVILISRDNLIINLDSGLFLKFFAKLHLRVIHPVLTCHYSNGCIALRMNCLCIYSDRSCCHCTTKKCSH